jgi:hypothetical protein
MINEQNQWLNDWSLVRRAQVGELNAFEALTDLYEDRVYSLLLRMLRQQEDDEDVTQQTFCKRPGESWWISWRGQFFHLAAANRRQRRSPGNPQAGGSGKRLAERGD